MGTLKAKLARLRNELFVEQSSGGGGGGSAEGFSVARNGDARVALIGFPSVGKSSLLSTLTSTESIAAGYEFTVRVKTNKGCCHDRNRAVAFLQQLLLTTHSLYIHTYIYLSGTTQWLLGSDLDVHSRRPQVQGQQSTNP